MHQMLLTSVTWSQTDYSPAFYPYDQLLESPPWCQQLSCIELKGTHIIYSSQSGPLIGHWASHMSSARTRLSPASGTRGQPLEQHTCSAYGTGDLKGRPLETWPLLPQDSISVEKPVFNLRFLGSCQPAGHGTFLDFPPRIRKASFCSTSRKLNQRKSPNPIAMDCPGCSQMVIINDASGSFLSCFSDQRDLLYQEPVCLMTEYKQ